MQHYKFIVSFSALLFTACAATDSESESADQVNGKADSFGNKTTLSVTGHPSITKIELDKPFQCDMNQFNTLGG